MKSLFRNAQVGAMIITLAAAVPAITLPNAPAGAGFDEDQQLCNTNGVDPTSRIAACVEGWPIGQPGRRRSTVRASSKRSKATWHSGAA